MEKPNTTRIGVFAALALVLASGCKHDTQPSARAAATSEPTPFAVTKDTKWKTVEVFSYAWKQGQSPVQFKLELPEGYDDPGDFIRVRIQVKGRPEFVLDNDDGWIEYNSQEQKSGVYEKLKARNLVQSKYALVLSSSSRNGDPPLVFLRSWGYASDAERLHVIGFKPSGEPVLLFNNEFDLSGVSDLDGDGYMEFAGTPCMSASLGWTDEYELGTYVPQQVYKIPQPGGGEAVLSESLTKKATMAHVGGWAGTTCEDHHVIVWPKANDKKPRVVSEQEAENLRKPIRNE